jgi:hypothetical protein
MSVRSPILAPSISAVVLAVTMLAAGPSAASARPGSSSHRIGAAARPAPARLAARRICFSNLAVQSEVGIVSQDFGPGEHAFDSQGADDFTLSRRCRVSGVGIDGLVYNGVANSFTVTFYRDRAGVPGKVVSTATSATLGPCPPHVVCDTAITLPSPVVLRTGGNWVSVQANLDFGEGEFVWMTRTTQAGAPAVWQNPGDGWGTGCTTWTNMQSCWASLSPGPDFEFVLLK